MSDLSTLGGPASIGVEVDVGPTGIRGTNFFLSFGDPNVPTTNLTDAAGNIYRFTVGGTTTVLQQPLRFDVAFNVDPQHPDYLFVYQYNRIPGNPNLFWIKAVRLVPNSNARNVDVNFVEGEAEFSVNIPLPPVYEKNPQGIPTRVSVDHSVVNKIAEGPVEYQNPASSSIKIESISVNNNVATFNFSLTSVTYSDEEWVLTEGLKTTHLVITVV